MNPTPEEGKALAEHAEHHAITEAQPRPPRSVRPKHGTKVPPRTVPAVPPSARVEAATEAELALEVLLHKLLAWLFQQPEWMFVLAADRQTRKTVGNAVAKTITRIPPVPSFVTGPTEEEK